MAEPCPWCAHGNPPIQNCADDTWYHIYTDPDGCQKAADCQRLKPKEKP